MTTTITDVTTLDRELNEMILSGKLLEAFDRFYADDCVMQENGGEPRVGKEANRSYEEQFVNSVAEFHGAKLMASAVEDEVTFSEWQWDVTFKEGGRTTMNQVAVRRWKDGEVSAERFYYDAS